MALGNIRERLKLHFDAEGTLESRVRDTMYEVHIRMPYRTAAASSASTAEPPRSLAKPAARRDESAPALRDASTGALRG
jgi:hypothetical protein